VQLELPETGVCNTRFAYDDSAADQSSGCCGSAAPLGEAEAARSVGCCGSTKPAAAASASTLGFHSVSPNGASALRFFSLAFSCRAFKLSGCSTSSDAPRKYRLMQWLRALSRSGANCCT
jgi:hypothetical protein